MVDRRFSKIAVFFNFFSIETLSGLLRVLIKRDRPTSVKNAIFLTKTNCTNSLV